MNTHRTRLLAGVSVALMLAVLPASATPSGDRLIAAAQDGLDAQVGAALAAHADVNAVDSAGATALAWAVMRGNAPIAERLLKAHADPNRTDANGVSPLMLAIDSNAPGLVKLLLANGADPSLVRDNGETPLMHAVNSGSLDMVRMLVDAKADVNARENHFGQTALMWAAGHPDMTRLLLDHGADFRAVTKSWETNTVNYVTVTSTLGSTGIPWNNEGTYSGKAGGSTPMLFAIQAGDLKSVEMLIAAGADVNQAAADGTTPLLTSLYNFSIGGGQRGRAGAIRYAPSVPIANLLLDHGAKVDVSDRAGYTPLHGAMLVLVARRHGPASPDRFPADQAFHPRCAGKPLPFPRMRRSGFEASRRGCWTCMPIPMRRPGTPHRARWGRCASIRPMPAQRHSTWPPLRTVPG